MQKLLIAAMALVCVFLTSCNKDKDEHLEMNIYQTCKVPSGVSLNGNVYDSNLGLIYGVNTDGYGVCFKKYLDENNQPVIENEGRYINVSDWGKKVTNAEVSGSKGLWENVTYKHLYFYKFHIELIEVQPEPVDSTKSSIK